VPTPTVRMQTFPNNEIRCVFYYARDKVDTLIPDQPSDSESPLDITSKLKTPQFDGHLYLEAVSLMDSPKAGYGVPGQGNGFSTNGRRRMLRAGAVLDELADYPQQILFATGTLPGSTYESKLAMAAWSGWAVNAMKAWFAKRVPDKLDMYVWEFQKRGALHIHYAILVKDTATRKRLLKEWKPQWQRIIDGIGIKAGVDMWRKNANYTHANNKEVLQADIQECEKSIARYLSKYVSKSQQQYLDNHWKQCKPSRFWGISRPLCKALERRTVTEVIPLRNRRELETMHEDCLSVLTSNCEIVHTYEVKKARAKVLVAYANPGEQSWLLSRMVIKSSSKGKLLEPSLSEQDRLFLRIGRCLNQSSQLRSVVGLNSGGTYLTSVLNMGLLESVSSSIKDSLILDFRWFIWQTMEQSIYVPDILKQTHKELKEYCMAHLGPYSSREVTSTPVETLPPKVKKLGNLQLTLGQ
jgi:hypothetical protein